MFVHAFSLRLSKEGVRCQRFVLRITVCEIVARRKEREGGGTGGGGGGGGERVEGGSKEKSLCALYVLISR